MLHAYGDNMNNVFNGWRDMLKSFLVCTLVASFSLVSTATFSAVIRGKGPVATPATKEPTTKGQQVLKANTVQKAQKGRAIKGNRTPTQGIGDLL